MVIVHKDLGQKYCIYSSVSKYLCLLQCIQLCRWIVHWLEWHQRIVPRVISGGESYGFIFTLLEITVGGDENCLSVASEMIFAFAPKLTSMIS